MANGGNRPLQYNERFATIFVTALFIQIAPSEKSLRKFSFGSIPQMKFVMRRRNSFCGPRAEFPKSRKDYGAQRR